MAAVSETSQRLSWLFLFSPGITYSNGEQWKVLRNFSIQILWNSRMGKRSLEEQTMEEGNFLLVELWKTGGWGPRVLSMSLSHIYPT